MRKTQLPDQISNSKLLTMKSEFCFLMLSQKYEFL